VPLRRNFRGYYHIRTKFFRKNNNKNNAYAAMITVNLFDEHATVSNGHRH